MLSFHQGGSKQLYVSTSKSR